MTMMTKAARAARGFGVRPKRIIRVKKGVYRLVMPRGRTYILKEMPVSAKSLRWIDRSLRKIRKHGFKRIAWRNPRKKAGRRHFVRNAGRGFPYVLVPWISGRWPSVHSRRDMRACGVALAKFHKAGRRIRRSQQGAVNWVGKWPSDFRRKHQFLSNMIHLAARQPSNLGLLGRHLNAHGKEILVYSQQTQRLLRQRGYYKICRSRRHLISLCHGDGGPSNFIRNARGMHVIDFETLRVDLRAYDLYRVLYNSCKDHSWNFVIARHILDGYQSVSRLKKEDFAMLRTLFRFPRSTYLLLSRYRWAKNKDMVAKRFPRALAAERRMAIFCKQLHQYVRR
jgi:CotS family spore coat protein